MDTRGWTDIAYNLVVWAHGAVYEGRGRDRGNGANGDDSNATRYSVCAMVGEGDPQPDALLDGLADAVNLARSWGAGRSVDGHRDHQSTACPGDKLYAFVKAGIPADKPTQEGTEMKLTDTIPGAKDPDGSPVTVGEALARAAWLYANRANLTARGDHAYAQVVEGGAIDQRLDADDTADASLELRVRRLEAAAKAQG
jgi:hypothetical protein